jgi:DNA modification methylase
VSVDILHGDCREVMATLPAESVQTCVTSPPYWGLRDYGVPGQLGLEKTPDEYVAKMVEVFREVRRVLRNDGTLWLNLGDSYTASARGGHSTKFPGRDKTAHMFESRTIDCGGLKPKDLVGIPWRVAFALQADGWYLRSDIIWHKPNPMPESVTDRPTKAHEYLFLLTRSERYYYDADAIAEESIGGPQIRSRASNFKKAGISGNHTSGAEDYVLGSTRNRRTVWTVATRPYKGAHFATFPPKLIEPCILAGSASKACEHCGAAWVRVVEKVFKGDGNPIPYEGRQSMGSKMALSGAQLAAWKAANPDKHLGFAPACPCPDNNGTACSTVLDPFGGSGTTGAVAEQHGRNAILIELNASYLPLQRERLAKVQPVLGVA